MWAIYALLSSFSAAFASIFQKETLKNLHAAQLMIVTTIITSSVAILTLPFFKFDINFKAFALILVYSIMTSFATIFTIRAMRHLDVSVVAPFFNLGTAFTALLAFLFFSEKITIFDLAGILLLIVGGYLLELKGKNPIQPFRDILRSDSIHYLLGGVLLFSGGYLVAKYTLSTVAPLLLFSLQQLISLIIYVFFTFAIYGGLKDIKTGFKRGGILLIPMAALIILENIFIFQALKEGEASLVIPLYRTWTLWAVILGGRILHEKYWFKRLSSATLMIIGALLILL